MGNWRYYNGKAILEFRNYDELISYLAVDNVKCGTELDNPKLDLIGVNDGDIVKRTQRASFNVVTGYYDYEMVEIPRNHRIITPDGNYIWNDIIKNDILRKDAKEATEIRDSWWLWHRGLHPSRWARYYARYECAEPVFRREPVPHVHKLRGGGYYRSITVMNEKRAGVDPEYKDFYRGGRGKDLPDVYDTEPRRDPRNRGWKRQEHSRTKQWHRTFTKDNGVYVVKGHDKRRAVDFDIDALSREICA